MNCSKCNAWVPDDSAFCPECGQKIEAPAPAAPVEPAAPEAPAAQVFCSNCGAAMAATDAFCENCGAKAEAPAAPAAGSIVDKVKQIIGKIPQKTRKIGAIALAAVLVIVLVSCLFSGEKVYNYALFIQNGEVQYAEMPKAKNPIEITSNLGDDVTDSMLANAAYSLGEYFKLSSDGKTLFYPDKVDDDGFTLYCRDVSKPKKEPVKIDSGLSEYYEINEKGTLVTYMKDGKLYQHDLKEKTKVASDVSDFAVSADGKTVLYSVYDEDGYTLYIKKGNKDAEKIASDITEIHHFSEDLSVVYYSKEDSLYSHKVGKDAEKIASDVDDVIHVYDSGDIYYTVSEDSDLTYWDLIKDDYEDKDDWSYEYYAEWMKETELDIDFCSLCYYNGKESVTVSESMVDWTSITTVSPLIVITAIDGELPTWSLTDYINGDVDLWDELHEHLDENGLYYVVAEEEIAELDMEDIYSVSISGATGTLYVRADYDSEDETATLYKITLNGAKVKKSEKMDEEIYAYRLSVTGKDKKDHVVYFKDVDDEEGELYLDGKKVDDDVYLYAITYNFEADQLFYIVDWDDEDSLGTLKYWNGKKATSVKDDVSTYLFTPEGECLFLYDYDDYNGELWILDGKKTEKIADDVIAIIPVH